MKYSIYDACFSENRQLSRGMSASYLAWEMSRNGISEYPIHASDVILATCQSPESVESIRTLRNRYPQKKIIAGGSASTSPYSLGKYCDAVCVGDGQKFLKVLFHDGVNEAINLPNVWVDGETRLVEIDQGFPWDMPPIQAEDGAYRVYCGRGCKNKCRFCQTGWAYRFSENPNPDHLIAQVYQLIREGKKVAYLSNDVMQHDFFPQLPPTEHGSYSLKYIAKNGLPPARQIRIGVEGVSEKLRSSVAKPITTRELIDCTAWLNQCHKSVRWFMIAGLPGETTDDWEELRSVIQTWKKKTSRGVLALSFTAFTPEPATPLVSMPLIDNYWTNFLKFKEWFFGGRGWSNRIKLMNPQSPPARLQKAINTTGLNEIQLREGNHISPNCRVNYPYVSNTHINNHG